MTAPHGTVWVFAGGAGGGKASRIRCRLRTQSHFYPPDVLTAFRVHTLGGYGADGEFEHEGSA
jgi:hypothetical protein